MSEEQDESRVVHSGSCPHVGQHHDHDLVVFLLHRRNILQWQPLELDLGSVVDFLKHLLISANVSGVLTIFHFNNLLKI